MSRKLSDEQKIEIVKKYRKGLHGAELAKEYKVTRQDIHYLLKNRNIPLNKTMSELRRKYSLNESYLDVLDCEEKAYFLGFMYADGCVCDDYTINLGLQESDFSILEKFKKNLQSSRPIAFGKRKMDNHKNMNILALNSMKLSKRLIELGCTPRKSLTLKFPTSDQVPEHLIRHFIRGYFDGDGSIYISKTRVSTLTCYCCVVSTLEFCNKIKQIIKTKLGINCNISKRFKESDTTTRQLRISGNKQIKLFLDWIYIDSTIYLERKFNKYQKIISILKERN